MPDIKQSVFLAISKVIDDGTFEKIVNERVQKTVVEIVDHALRQYSEFGKLLEAAVKESLRIDTKSVSLPEYNQVILSVIRAKLDAAVNTWGREKIAEEMDKLLTGEVPAEIKFSKLLKDFKEWARELNDNRSVTVIVGESKYGSVWIDMDPEPNKPKYQCAIRIMVSTDTGEVRGLWLEGKDVQKTFFIGGVFNFQRDLLQMHANKTRIIMDVEDPNLYHDDDD